MLFHCLFTVYSAFTAAVFHDGMDRYANMHAVQGVTSDQHQCVAGNTAYNVHVYHDLQIHAAGLCLMLLLLLVMELAEH